MAIKKSMEEVVEFLQANESALVKDVMSTPAFAALVEAKRGGGNGEENWLIVDGKKVGRVCAILGSFYLHDNEDKEASHFYKNGSYHIVVERLKNLKAKEHKANQEKELARLEDAMMEGEISPKEWKAAKDEVLKEFKFSISPELISYLVDLTQGYATKEDLAKAVADGTAVKYVDIQDDVNKYLAEVEAEMFPKETPKNDA